ncbi:hypothetical protein RJ639_013662 [Escallonia herrerae]|uniref:Uncharacterized protein n=1 Tax=Escallonia herrerae TaxID=1293975 RepID=A0AA88VH28_9ASTE|nr:hypothetical protein RJ639_013662 [Escallonia herrerae]
MAEEVLDSDAVRTSKKGGIKRDSDEIEKKEVAEAVPFYKLFCFADSTDYALMLAGTLTAVGSSLLMHCTVCLQVSLKFVYLAMGSGLAAFSHVVCWTVTGERQAARIRSLYLNSILRQDIGYFDKGTNTGEIIQSISSDTVVIQDAIGEKVGKFMQLAATFLGGFVIAFMKGWLLALVLISSIPPLAISAAAMTIFMTKLGSRGQTAYSVAATVVEQTVSSIRTVVSFAGERQAIAKFDKSLDKAYTSVVQEGLAAGLGIGIFMLVLCCNSALALWFGSKMIIEKEYTGGDVLNVIIAILTGSFSLGQASPCLSAFAGGQVAARKLFDTISRKPEIDSSDTDGKKLDDIRGSHSELVLDPEGAYFQLIQLQERKGKSEQQSVTEQHYSCYSSSVSNVVSDSKNTAAEPKALSSSLLETKTEISIRRLAYLNKPEVPELVVGSLAAVAIGLVLPALGVIFSSTISSFYEPVHDLREDSEFWASMFVILGLATLLAVPVSMYSFSVAGCKLVRRVQILCFEKMVQMEISWFDKLENSSGAISSRLSVDALSVRGLLGDTLALLVQNSATAIAGLVIAFKTSWQLAFIILLMLPLIGLNGYLQMKFMSGFSADSKELYEDASQVACDAVGNIRTVASFCAEEKVMQLYQNKGEGCRRAGIRQGLISGIGFGLSMLLLFWVYAATFYAGARLVEAGNITFAGVFRVFFSLSMAAIGISQSGSPSSDSAKAMKAAASVFALLDQKSRIDSSDESGITCEAVKGDIEFSHVSFKYPSRPDVQILGDFCLVIPSGKILKAILSDDLRFTYQTVALVGESGSGKSTVLSLLQRFYDPDSGQVMLDGVQIQKLKLKWLRQQMGLVSQEPILFNDTIRGNITYGLEGNITEAEIFAASELANAHKFISGLQQGYDTIVGEQGIQLSGGQKQRVAIARAIVRAPKVLLLDEATSALDAESEKAVQDALNRVMVERTTVLVAHRLSTIRCADSIAVVKNGVISERGKHDALINIKDESGRGKDIIAAQITATAGQLPEMMTTKTLEKSGSKQNLDESKKKEVTNTISFYKLFSFADSTDYVLMFIGTITAIGSGMCLPFMTVVFGDLVNVFGGTVDTKELVHEVSKVSLKYVYLALGSGLAGFSQVVCWIVTGERQAARIRSLYLKTILRQDIGFFDKETSTGEIIERMSGDTVIIQDAMGEKVGKFIQVVTTFLGGFVIAFIKGWHLTLVLISAIPPLVISASVMTILMAKLLSRGQAAYSVAATVVEQTIASIRTVASFTGERQAVAKYDKSLRKAYKAGVQEGLAAGLGSSVFMFVIFCSYGLAVWFGARMILHKSYTGGDVLNVMMAVLTGSFTLGQASPCLSAFAAGRVAAFKMFQTIRRKPDIDTYDTSGQVLDDIRSHSELLQDPEGAYCQLIRLQELGNESEHLASSDQDRLEITMDSGRHSSQRFSILRSVSRGSSGIGNSSRHSFSVSIGLPTAISVLEMAVSEPRAPPLAPPQTKPDFSLRRLAYLNKPEIPVLVAGSIAALLNGVILPVFGLLLSTIIKIFYEPPHKLRKDSEFWALIYVLLGVGTLLVAPLRMYFFAVAGCKLIRRIRLMCFEKVVQMEISWFDRIENSSGAIGARLSADASSVRGLVGDSLGLLVQNTATAIAGLVIGFVASWQLSLIIILLLPFIGLNGYLQIKYISGFSADTKQKLYEDASQVASDAVGSIRTVASFSAEEKVMQLYKKKCEGPSRAGMKQGLISGVGYGLSMSFLFFVYATSFYIGARFVEAGKMTFSDVFRVFFGLSMAAIGISQSGGLAPDSGKAEIAAASVFALLDQKSKIDPSDDSGTTLENVKGDIEFQHVSFKYATRPDVQIFSDLCLLIRSGKTVALVGESGSGKSTVISLLQRFYDPDSGRIALDGVEIQKLNLKWFRQQMGLVSQEPVLFNDTIRANIAYGKEGNATEAEISAAAELANAHKFISGLQQGYDTVVGERGIQLSGGQKQRVAIARAIVKAPKILLLDEATSALDAESEKVVQDALDRAMVDRTTVIVAHRLSTIRGADLIAVVKNGGIAEKGKHESLINAKDGVYASLVALHTSGSSS